MVDRPPPSPAEPPDDTWVETWLSVPRFDRYLAAAGADRTRALRLYEWNARVSAACQRDLGHVEVALRNAYDRAAAGWGGPGHWLLHGHQTVFAPLTRTRHGRRIDVNRRPREQVERAIGDAGGPAATAGKVVAQLTFGFWRFLSTTAHEKTLWVPYLHRAFPPGNKRADVDALAGRLHDLRNRVAHYEHLLGEDLPGRYADLRTLAQLTCPPAGRPPRCHQRAALTAHPTTVIGTPRTARCRDGTCPPCRRYLPDTRRGSAHVRARRLWDAARRRSRRPARAR